MSLSFKNGYALLIGVGECAYPKWSLPVTVRDVEALEAMLANPNSCGYIETNIHTLTNKQANQQAILDELHWLQKIANNDSETTVIIYYSGHGWLDKLSNSYYLIQHDIEPFDIPGTALKAKVFTEELRKIQSDRLLVIVDSCHAAGMATSKDKPSHSRIPNDFISVAPNKDIFSSLTAKKGRAVFMSCAGYQQSWIREDQTMSIFTNHLLEALNGAANLKGDKTVTVSNLMNHLGKTVNISTQKAYQRIQEPQFDFSTEDFAIALLQGGKGLSYSDWDTMRNESPDTIRIQGVAFGNRSVSIGGNANNTSISTGDNSIVR